MNNPSQSTLIYVTRPRTQRSLHRLSNTKQKTKNKFKNLKRKKENHNVKNGGVWVVTSSFIRGHTHIISWCIFTDWSKLEPEGREPLLYTLRAWLNFFFSFQIVVRVVHLSSPTGRERTEQKRNPKKKQKKFVGAGGGRTGLDSIS
jgi:hypothetical protein